MRYFTPLQRRARLMALTRSEQQQTQSRVQRLRELTVQRQENERARVRNAQTGTRIQGPFPSLAEKISAASWRRPGSLAPVPRPILGPPDTASPILRQEATNLLRGTPYATDQYTTPEERERLISAGPDVVRALLEQGNVGPVSDIGSPARASGSLGELISGGPRTLFDEEPLPGLAGRFLGGPAGAVSTLGTAGLGTFGSFGARAGVGAGGIVGGPLGAEAGGAIDPRLRLPGALAGGLAGGLSGGVAGARAQTVAGIAAREGVANIPESLAALRRNPEFGGTAIGEDIPYAEQYPLGTTAIDRAVEFNEGTLTRAGRVTQLPGVRQVLGVLNPSIRQGRRGLVAVNAAEGIGPNVKASVRDRATRAWTIAKTAFDSAPPRYIGPEDNRFANTWVDWAENPRFYEATPEQMDALAAAGRLQDEGLVPLRTETSIDVKPVRNPNDPNGIYIPHIQDASDVDDDLMHLVQRATKGSYTKERMFPSNYERGVSDPDYTPSQNVEQLADVYAGSMGSAARTRAVQVGTGDMTKVAVLEQEKPGLRAARDEAQKLVDSIKARIKTATARSQAAGRQNRTTASKQAQLERRIAEIEDKYDPLVNSTEYGPEYSHLAGQLYELRLQLARLQATDVPGSELAGLKAELTQAESRLSSLRRAYGAKIDPRKWAYSARTNRYHPPDEAVDMERLLLSRDEVEHWPIIGPVTRVLTESSLIRVGLDAGYAAIQFPLQVFFAPDSLVRSFQQHGWRMLTNPANEIRSFRQQFPEIVQDFERSFKREWGTPAQDFAQAHRGAERVRPVRAMTHHMTEILDIMRMMAWRNDRKLLEAFGSNVDEAMGEATSASQKFFPSQSPIERGVGSGRASLERTPVVAPSFITAPAGLMKDATSGLAKLVANRHLNPADRWNVMSGREQLAIIRSTMFVGMLGATGVSTWIAAGKSPEEAAKMVYDPNDKRFMSVAIPGTNRYIPLGTPFRGFVKAIWPHDTSVFGADVPGTVTVEGQKIPIPFVGVPEWVAGKATPAIQFARRGIFENREFDDTLIRKGKNPVDDIANTVWYGVEQHLPLAAGGISEGIRRGKSVGDTIESTLGQTFGADVRQPSPGEERTDEIGDMLKGAPPEVAAQAGRPKHELDVDALLFIEENENVKKLSDEIDQGQRDKGDKAQLTADEVEKQRAVIRAEQDQLDAGFNAGEISPEDYVNATTENQRESWARADALYSASGIKFADPGKNTPIKAALDNYFNVELKRVNGELDYDTWDAEREAALAPLSPTQRAAAMEWLSRNKTETEKRLDTAQELRSTLYDTISPISGLPVEEFGYIKDFEREVEVEREYWLDEFGRDVPMKDAINQVAAERGTDPGIVDWAQKLRSQTYKEKHANPEWFIFLSENENRLRPFFPNLYTRGVLSDLFETMGPRSTR